MSEEQHEMLDGLFYSLTKRFPHEFGYYVIAKDRESALHGRLLLFILAKACAGKTRDVWQRDGAEYGKGKWEKVWPKPEEQE